MAHTPYRVQVVVTVTAYASNDLDAATAGEALVRRALRGLDADLSVNDIPVHL